MFRNEIKIRGDRAEMIKKANVLERLSKICFVSKVLTENTVF